MSLHVGEVKLSGGKSQVHAQGGMDSAPWKLPFPQKCHSGSSYSGIQTCFPPQPEEWTTVYSLIQAATTLPAPPSINHFLSGPNLINFTSLIGPALSTFFFPDPGTTLLYSLIILPILSCLLTGSLLVTPVCQPVFFRR